MNLLLNLLWIFLGGGFIIFIEYVIGGMLFCLTIIGIPFGLQCFKLAAFALMPFGSKAIQTKSADGCLAVVFNVMWILLGGIWIAVTHLVFALISALTIIGIPFAVQHLKMAGFALTPFGKRISSN
jgi:uncharacterized membrane protein YccF (DUF307 family)